MDSEFTLSIFSHPDSSPFHLFVGFHYTLKQYGGWIRTVQLSCQYSTAQCIIELHEILQMWLMSLTNGGGSSPCNIDAIFTVFTISFNSAMTLLFRYAYSPQEQPLVQRSPYFLTHEDRPLLLIFSQIRMPFSAPTGFMAPPRPGVFVGVSRSGTLDQGSPFHIRAHLNYSVVVAFWTFVACVIYTCPVIGVRCCKAWAIHPAFENLFRYSFCHTSYLSPFPFSAIAQVINKHTRYRRSSPGTQLYFVCNNCWTYSRHVSVLHEPCWGCHILESVGWEFWTPGRGRSAWWRHPCWMFILIFFH